MWTLIEGINLANQLEKALKREGFHCALGGSVLHSGTSNKDLDIFIYPHHTTDKKTDWSRAELVIEQCGLNIVRTCVHKYDNKLVKQATCVGKRIDFFFVQ